MGSGIMEDRQFAIETPVGSIVSDSGDHLTDVVTVLGVVLVLFVGKKIISYLVRR